MTQSDEFFNQVYGHAALVNSAATVEEAAKITLRIAENHAAFSDEMRIFYVERLRTVISLLHEIESGALSTLRRTP